jgi:RNA polymerase sigma-70 factor (ECF subfamily)
MPLDPAFQSVPAAAQTGAEWALARLYRDVHPPLLRYLRAQEPHESEDLASETWLDAAAGLGSFEGDEAAFRSWVFTSARRRLIDLRRARKRRRTAPVAAHLLDEEGPAAPLRAAESEGVLPYLKALSPEHAERSPGRFGSSRSGPSSGSPPSSPKTYRRL